MTTQAEVFWWALGLIVGVPIVIVVLGEAASRLRSRDSAYLVPVELARTVAVPAVVGFLIVRRLLNLDAGHAVARVTTSVLLVSVGYVAFILLRLVAREKRQDRWESKVPSLFKIMLRIAVIVVPILLMFDTWGIDLTSNLSALGIGGLAIAFALQDAIGNVVSGILLVLDRPFSVGDWIEVDGLHGEVVDISWRSTRIRVDADIVVLPNITLSGSSIRNLTAVDPSHDATIEFSFSSEDRPSDVKAMLVEVARDNPLVSTQSPPEIHTVAFGDSTITYRLNYKLDEYEGDVAALRVQDQLRSAVFYAHARHGLSMPYPILIQLDERALEANPSPLDHAPAFLTVNTLFSRLPQEVLQQLAAEVTARVYAAGETMLWPDQVNHDIQIVTTGEALMIPATASASSCEGIALAAGQLIGEQSLVSSAQGVWRVEARTDVEVFVLDIELVRSLVEQHSRFAVALNDLMKERARFLRDHVHVGTDHSAIESGRSQQAIDLT